MIGVNLSAAPTTPLRLPASARLPPRSPALNTVKTAIAQLATDRASVGSNLARLNSTADQLGVPGTTSPANSRIRDVDVAEESTQFARYNILVQAGTAMLAQANHNRKACCDCSSKFGIG